MARHLNDTTNQTEASITQQLNDTSKQFAPVASLNSNLNATPNGNLNGNLNATPQEQASLRREKRYFNQQQQMSYMHQLILQQAVNYDSQRKNRARADPVASTAAPVAADKNPNSTREEICSLVKSMEAGRLIKSKYCCRRFVREHCEKASLEAEPESTACDFDGLGEFKSKCIGDW